MSAEVERMPLTLPIVNGHIVPLPTSQQCIHGFGFGKHESCDICLHLVQQHRAGSVSIGGDVLPVPLWQFERSASVLLADEQAKVAPDNALIGFICNAVRLAREREHVRLADASLLRLIARMLPYVQQADAADGFEIEAADAVVREVEALLAGSGANGPAG